MSFKRVQVDTLPINPGAIELAKRLIHDPTATPNERLLAALIMEMQTALNSLLCKFEYGLVSISEEPPDDTKRFARRTL